MKITIKKRSLNKKEINSLVEEIKKFPNPLTSKRTWQSLRDVYIGYNSSELVGVCGVVKLKDWIKLGPFVVFKKYHHKGIGTLIFKSIVKDYPSSNLYVGSRNPGVAKIAFGFGFREEDIWKLPRAVKKYLIWKILENISLSYLRECMRKQSTKEGPYRNSLREH